MLYLLCFKAGSSPDTRSRIDERWPAESDLQVEVSEDVVVVDAEQPTAQAVYDYLLGPAPGGDIVIAAFQDHYVLPEGEVAQWLARHGS
jgi:hypothetical protein